MKRDCYQIYILILQESWYYWKVFNIGKVFILISPSLSYQVSRGVLLSFCCRFATQPNSNINHSIDLMHAFGLNISNSCIRTNKFIFSRKCLIWQLSTISQGYSLFLAKTIKCVFRAKLDGRKTLRKIIRNFIKTLISKTCNS